MKVNDPMAAHKTQKKVFTYEDWQKLPEDSGAYELIEGELVMSPSPQVMHQKVVKSIFRKLDEYVERENLGIVLFAPLDVVLSDLNICQPDIIFISRENKEIITEKNIQGAPDLIIEILSPSTTYRDLFDKKELYAKFGVNEYWIADPKRRWIETYSLQDNTYKQIQRSEKSGKITSAVVKGFEIKLEAVFEE